MLTLDKVSAMETSHEGPEIVAESTGLSTVVPVLVPVRAVRVGFYSGESEQQRCSSVLTGKPAGETWLLCFVEQAVSLAFTKENGARSVFCGAWCPY